jgi:hypothetical protein
MRSPSAGLRVLADTHLEGASPPARSPERELSQVELRCASGPWGVGTQGVIVDAFESNATIEIADEDGRTLDLLTLPYHAFTVLDSGHQERLAL